MRVAVVLFALATAAQVLCGDAEPLPDLSAAIDRAGVINVRDRVFVDADGRERIFHGVNVVYKGTPWHPRVDKFDLTQSFTEEDMKILAENGQNVIRLGMMWPGVEPTRGEYNETYLEVMQSIVAKAKQYGIYAILDFHQDDLSEKFCGEGVPLWAAQPKPTARPFPQPLHDGYPVDEQGVPSPEDCGRFGWPTYQFSEACVSAYQSLYSNRDGIRDAFAAFWATVAERFAPQTSTLAYEIINEPGAGDIFRNPLLLVPGVADYFNLAPMYEQVNEAVRQVDDKHMLFFAGVTWDDLYTGFLRVPGGIEYSDRNVLAYHYYSNINFSYKLISFVRWIDRLRLNAATFLTEWEIGSTDPAGLASARQTADIADEWLQSWTGWEYKHFDPITGANNGFFPYYESGNATLSPIVNILSRAYAQATAGRVKRMRFDQDTADFELRYAADQGCQLPTEIYLNEGLHYAGGFTVSVQPDGLVSWTQPRRNAVHVHHSAALEDGQEVVVRIARRA